MVIDHVGVAVGSIDEAVPQWERMFGYVRTSEPVINTRQKVKVVFLAKPGSLPVKLIEPLDAASPIHAFSRRGGGLHHLCFRCDSVPAQVERMRAAGARVLSEPQPGEAFDNEAIAFVYAAGLNVELIDTDRRARSLGPAPTTKDAT